MKVIKTDEEFTSPQSRKRHYRRHVKDNNKDEFSISQFKSEERYEEAADALAAIPIRTSDLNSSDDVIGFEEYYNDRTAYLKYRKSTQEVVVYFPSRKARTGNYIISYYKANPNKYNILFDKYYKDEINKDINDD